LSVTGELSLAIVPGLGVLAGFFAGSAAMLFLWLIIYPGRPKKERR
jgi:hypothetical protein